MTTAVATRLLITGFQVQVLGGSLEHSGNGRGERMQQSESVRRATMVDWFASPALLTVDQSAFLLGVDVATIQELIQAGGIDAVEADGALLVDKASLRDFQDALHEVTRAG